MADETDDIETRLSKCERVLFGSDDSAKGLSARMHMTEHTLEKIEATLSKLNWMIVAGVVVGILNIVINKPSGGAPQQSTSVITGDAATKGLLTDTRRTYLTTADVAAKEKLSVREVTEMIATGEIQPPPVKDGREWRIPTDYRILPHSAAECGIQP